METVTCEGVIAHNVNKFPSVDSWEYYSISELDDYDLKILARAGFVEVWYWYGTAPYEGTGELIGRNADGKWADISLGHCSCYGPVEDRGADVWHDSLADLKARYITEQVLAHSAELFAAVEQKE